MKSTSTFGITTALVAGLLTVGCGSKSQTALNNTDSLTGENAQQMQDVAFKAQSALQHIEEAQNTLGQNDLAETRSHLYKADTLLERARVERAQLEIARAESARTNRLESEKVVLRTKDLLTNAEQQIRVQKTYSTPINWTPVYKQVDQLSITHPQDAQYVRTELGTVQEHLQRGRVREAQARLATINENLRPNQGSLADARNTVNVPVVAGKETRVREALSLLNANDKAQAATVLEQIESDLKSEFTSLLNVRTGTGTTTTTTTTTTAPNTPKTDVNTTTR